MKLVIATPIDGGDLYAGRVTLGYAENREQLRREMSGVETVVDFLGDVGRARNRAAALILRDFRDATHVLWWDDDEYPEDRSCVRKMIESGEDLIGMPYTNKRPPLRWVHQLMHPCPVAVNGVQRVRYIGFGFTLTTRACLEKMYASSRKYRDDGVLRPADMFGHMFVDPRSSSQETYCPEADQVKLSEDFSFCQRWTDLGGRVTLLTNAGVVYHAGSHGWSLNDVSPGGMLTM